MKVVEFYKAWDRYGALSNFSPHPVRLPSADGTPRMWATVEHYYQAQKFAGVDDPAALALMEASIPLRRPQGLGEGHNLTFLRGIIELQVTCLVGMYVIGMCPTGSSVA